MTAPPQPLEAAGTITLKAVANLPARLFGGNAQQVTVTGLDYTLHLDIEKLPADETPVGSDYWAPVWDKNTDTYKRVDISSLTGGGSGSGQTILTSNITLYVDVVGGSDITGNGSVGMPFQSFRHALDHIADTYINSGYTIEMKLADGIYEGWTVNGDFHRPIDGPLWIHGNNTNPENVEIIGTTFEAFGAGGGGGFFISDCKVSSTVTVVLASSGGYLAMGRPEMGGYGGRLLIGRAASATYGYLLYCFGGGTITDLTQNGIEIDTGGVSIGGIALAHGHGTISLNGGCKINGNHTWLRAGVAASGGALVEVYTPMTVLGGGTVTGKKYQILTGGILDGDPADIATIPGSVEGTQTIGGALTKLSVDASDGSLYLGTADTAAATKSFKVFNYINSPNFDSIGFGYSFGNQPRIESNKIAGGVFVDQPLLIDFNGTNRYIFSSLGLTINCGLGVFGVAPPTVRPTVTGSRGGNAALASLLTALAATGILVDGTTA